MNQQNNPKPKRILIFSLVYLPIQVGGAEVAVKEIVDRIDPDTVAFDMVTLQYDRAYPRTEQIGNVRVHRVGFGITNPDVAKLSAWPLKLTKILFPILAYRKAKQLHRKNQYESIWALMANYAGLAATLLKRKYPSLRYILTLQEGDDLDVLQKKTRWFRPLFLDMFRTADRVQAISRFLADFAKEMGHTGSVALVPNAVDYAHFSQQTTKEQYTALRQKIGLAPGDTMVITTSRLVYKNAVDDLIVAMASLPQQTKLVILGLGPDKAMLESLVQKHGLQRRIFFLGHVDHKELPTYLQASDVFVRASRTEGLGNSFLEAMAAGVPVIATPVGGIPDFLDDGVTGFVCNVDAPESIATQVTRVLDPANKALVARVRGTAQTMVRERYTWDVVSTQMRELFV